MSRGSAIKPGPQRCMESTAWRMGTCLHLRLSAVSGRTRQCMHARLGQVLRCSRSTLQQYLSAGTGKLLYKTIASPRGQSKARLCRSSQVVAETCSMAQAQEQLDQRFSPESSPFMVRMTRLQCNMRSPAAIHMRSAGV